MLGLERGKVTLCPHTPEWDEEATRTIGVLKNVLGDVAIGIEHVGSTSIKNIKAKPIIDIAVAVRNFSDILSLNRELEEHGFYYRYATDNHNNNLRGETDLPESCIEKLLYASGGYYDGTSKLQTHFIHVIKADSAEWKNLIFFRDYLNLHPAIAKEYEDLKIKLCEEHADDRNIYTAQKNDFIKKVLCALK